jgi:hypothetical protein
MLLAMLAVRLAAAAFGVAAAAVGLILLGQHRATALGTAMLIVLALGGANYAAGILVWRGTAAYRLRVAGWAAMMCALLVPSTLSLALPVVALLGLTLRSARPAPRAFGQGSGATP